MAKAKQRTRNHRPPQAEIDAKLAQLEDDDDAVQLAAALAEKRAIEARRDDAAAQRRELRESRVSIRSYSSDGSPADRLGWARELLRYAAAARTMGRESLLRGWCELLRDHEQVGPKRGARLLLMAVNGEPEQAVAEYLGRSCELLSEGVPKGSDWRDGLDYIARNVQDSMPVAPEHCVDAHLWRRGDDDWEAPPLRSETPGEPSDLPILSTPPELIDWTEWDTKTRWARALTISVDTFNRRVAAGTLTSETIKHRTRIAKKHLS